MMYFALCKEQQHRQKGIFHGYGVAEASPEFQAGCNEQRMRKTNF
jgi:hypothetical protein